MYTKVSDHKVCFVRQAPRSAADPAFMLEVLVGCNPVIRTVPGIAGMARSGRVAVPVLLCLGLAAFVSQSSVFVPAPQSSNRLPAAAAVAAPALLAGAPAAFADAIGDAAAKFSDATYPIAEKINWGNTPIISSYFATESARNPAGVAQAVDKLLESGLTMDPSLIKAAVAAHDKALKSAASNPNLVTTKADFAAVNEALARMIASGNKVHGLHISRWQGSGGGHFCW